MPKLTKERVLCLSGWRACIVGSAVIVVVLTLDG